MVSGNSQAAGGKDAVTAPPIAGSIAFAFIWAFVGVMLLVSCYTAYSCRMPGRKCPLFLSPTTLIACNSIIVWGIPSIHQVYGQCMALTTGLAAPILIMCIWLLVVFWGNEVFFFIAKSFLLHEMDVKQEQRWYGYISTAWELAMIFIPVVVAYDQRLDRVICETSIVFSCIAALSTLLPHVPQLINVFRWESIPSAGRQIVQTPSTNPGYVPPVVMPKSLLQWNMSTKERRHQV
jgi:hypothetical protein